MGNKGNTAPSDEAPKDPFEENVRAAFVSIDTDGNGSIDKDEFLSAMREKKLSVDDPNIFEEWWEIVDLDGNGTIEFDEFLDAAVRMRDGGGGDSDCREADELLKSVLGGLDS